MVELPQHADLSLEGLDLLDSFLLSNGCYVNDLKGIMEAIEVIAAEVNFSIGPGTYQLETLVDAIEREVTGGRLLERLCTDCATTHLLLFIIITGMYFYRHLSLNK